MNLAALSVALTVISSTAQPNTPAGVCSLPESTPLQIELVDAVSSAKATIGDEFRVKLAKPAIVDGRVVLPADTPGIGQVIHAMKKKNGGRAGELILATRYLLIGDIRVPVRGFRINATGGEISGYLLVDATAVPTREGLETEVPVGTVAGAKVAQAVMLPCPEVPQR